MPSEIDNSCRRAHLQSDEAANQDHHRSKKTVRDLLEAAARLCGTDAAVYFGPKRQSELSTARESQLISLFSEAEAKAPPNASPAFTGGEHQVFELENRTRVLKHTLPGFYGRIMDELTLLDPRTFQNRNQLTLRAALPSEYLRRWAVLTDIFGLPTEYEGRTSDVRSPRMVISQPYIEQDDDDPPTAEDAAAFMEAMGFAKVDPSVIAIPEVADVTWYRQSDGILITDAHARNFRKDTASAAIIPIDLVVTVIAKGVSKVLPNPEREWHFTTTFTPQT
jgi:hypothetical protein